MANHLSILQCCMRGFVYQKCQKRVRQSRCINANTKHTLEVKRIKIITIKIFLKKGGYKNVELGFSIEI